jgi:imidazolonepropionase-like amidohydrolase
LQSREIVVEYGIIVAVGNGLREQYPLAELVDLGELVAVPGLIDVHVHMTYGLVHPPQGDAWSRLFASPPAERLVEATRNAQRTLQTGVTTVRDLFAFDGLAAELKALIDNDIIPGPRLFVAGAGIHTLTLTPLADGEQRDIVAEFKNQAEQRVKDGADWLKIFATTGSADDLSATQVFFYPEIKAATDIAHAAGLRVAVHSYGAVAVDDALRAGVDSIEHAVGLSDAQRARWARTDTVYVPTIDHNRYYAEHRDEYG